MQTQKLAEILRDSYERAPSGDKSGAVCLFGIKYSNEIGSNTNAIVKESGIGNYGPMVRMGIKLARDVRVR